jgi:NAD(P)H-flavin reductase
MGGDEPRSGLARRFPTARTRRSVTPDIDVAAPKGPYPISRGAPERKLTIVDRYDRRAVVTDYETLTPTGTVRLAFQVVDDKPFLYKPGQFIGIHAGLQSAEGSRTLRTPYCIVSPPTEDRRFKLLVRLVPEGPLSYYLGGLQVGDVISFRGPVGRSMIPKEWNSRLVLVATGVGVGPLLFLARELLEQGYDTGIVLYWGLRLAEDICLMDEVAELTALAGTADRFDYHLSLTQPPPRWTGLRGRVTETMPPLLDSLGGTRFYLVGNGAMIEELSVALSDMGVDRQFIYHEAFFNARYKADPEALDAIRKRFVAGDLFSPFAEQQAGFLHPEHPLGQRR